MADNHNIRVLIVDDSALARQTVGRMLAQHGRIELLQPARDGIEAVELAERLQPDVITLDLEMPRLDGLGALPRIKQVCDASVLMLSSATTDGSHATLSALRSGADDFIAKDGPLTGASGGALQRQLLRKIPQLAAARGRRQRGRGSVDHSVAPAAPPRLCVDDFEVVLIGGSTGGPPVIERVLEALPASFPRPVLVVQHMPRVFTEAMAKRLNETCALTVESAQQGTAAQPGHAYIAPGGSHLRLRRRVNGALYLEVSDKSDDALYKPSVDELFTSAARVCGGRCLALVLSGMGADGLRGGRALHAAGGTLLGQEPASCVVYGMPRAVAEAGLLTAALGPAQLGQTLRQMMPAAVA